MLASKHQIRVVSTIDMESSIQSYRSYEILKKLYHSCMNVDKIIQHVKFEYSAPMAHVRFENNVLSGNTLRWLPDVVIIMAEREKQEVCTKPTNDNYCCYLCVSNELLIIKD